jgi:hypothetical protein
VTLDDVRSAYGATVRILRPPYPDGLGQPEGTLEGTHYHLARVRLDTGQVLLASPTMLVLL